MAPEKRMVGVIGEDMAARFLKSRGYEILERNFRTVFGEIDIIARRSGITVFAEVKTRLSSSLGPPFLSVTRQKQAHMARSALCYLKMRGVVHSNWRIDVISVKLRNMKEAESIEVIENAVEDNNYSATQF